jgi:hypothetical protein
VGVLVVGFVGVVLVFVSSPQATATKSIDAKANFDNKFIFTVFNV